MDHVLEEAMKRAGIDPDEERQKRASGHHHIPPDQRVLGKQPEQAANPLNPGELGQLLNELPEDIRGLAEAKLREIESGQHVPETLSGGLSPGGDPESFDAADLVRRLRSGEL